ncbi:MAG TPA: polysaccharide deacetylase family protein [Candidatus Limnocylindria bacterium]|nr:polysaccharide deacetylase family protein [Candidatus Limnocylindria bacterium]
MRHSPRRFGKLGTLAVAVAVLAMSSAGVPASVAAADAPGSCSSGLPTSARNTWLTGTIGTSTDVDWYEFSVTSGSRAQVTLGNLPADYDLRVYRGCTTLVGSSNRSGRQFDEVYAYFRAGTYYVRVRGFDGARSVSRYALRFRTLAWGTPVLSSTTWTDSSGYLHIAGEVLNNTAEPRRWLQLDASLLNGSGASIGSAVGYPRVTTLAPWTRSPFEIVTRKPAGFAKAKVRVCTPSTTGGCLPGQVAGTPLAGLSVAQSPSFTDTAGRRHYVGSVLNGGSSTSFLTTAVVTVYNAYGNMKGIAAGGTRPGKVTAGAKGTYEIVGRGLAAPNRYVTTTTGTATGCSSGPRYTGGQENLVAPLTRGTASGRVALTFDMGGRMTPAVRILNILVENRVCATLFPTGAISRTAEGQAALAIVKAHPELFEVGNHTMHHCDLVRGGGGAPGAADAAICAALASPPTEAQVKQELIDGEQWIQEYTGMNARPFWRAPYGVSNLAVRTWAAELGYTKHWKWDVDTIDWRPISDGGPTARSMILKVVNGAKSGSVVLMHLGGYETPMALQGMIDGLRSRGFALTTLSDLAR